MSGANSHKIFRRFPISGRVKAQGHDLPTPYHVYDGAGTLLTATADPSAIAKAFEGQDVFPVLTEAGQGLVGLFICDFQQASHGPHSELHLTALCAPVPGQRIPDRPEAFLAALGQQPDWGLLSLHLWNNSAAVVAYNSDYLGLAAKLVSGCPQFGPEGLEFAFQSPGGQPLVSGKLALPKRTGWREMLALMRLMGMKAIFKAARQGFAEAWLINRKGAVLQDNRWAKTLSAPDKMVVSRFRPGRDRLDIHDATLGQFAITPQCAEHLFPFRFVYLHPDDSGAPAPT